MKRDSRLPGALALLSAALTAQQIALMQVLGWMHWHHFAYLIVAVALLGFGIAGTVLSLAREPLVTHARVVFPWLLLGTAVALPFGVRLIQLEPLAVDLPLVFLDPWSNSWRLVALCLLLLPPFFCGGLATGLMLTVHVRTAGRFYAASLAGAGAGGLVGLALVATLAPPRLPGAVGGLALAAVLCSMRWRRPADPVPGATDLREETDDDAEDDYVPASRGQTLALGLVIVALVVDALSPVDLRPSQFKPIRRTLDLPGARVVASQPSVRGWIQIVDAPALRPAPAVGLDYTGEIPAQPAVFINGLNYGSLLSASAARDPRWLEYTTDSVAWAAASPREHVLLLENGPGGWAALAAARGARSVTIVEPNRALVGLLASGEHPRAPEWRGAGCALIVASGRSFLRQTPQRFDLIRFPTVGALGGTAGLGSSSEQFLFTREAFSDAWERLAPHGVIAATAWMDFPERNALRLLATLVAVAEAAGVSPREHLVGIRGWATVTFLLRREPWPRAATAALREYADDRGFDLLLLPDIVPAEREQHHVWQNSGFFGLVDRLVAGPRDAVYREHPFSIRPTSDSRPYFSQFLRWTRIGELRAVFGATMPFFELGSLVVALTFVILAALGVVGIVLPLARLGWHTPAKGRLVFYFAGLGAGFMMVEIGLMLRAHAWLGSPVLAAAIVLTALLTASGAGSLGSERFAAGPRAQRRAVGTILGTVMAAAVVLGALEPIARGWPAAVQIIVLLAVVGPLGFTMGTAFPLALRQLAATAPAQVPWAWAVNGCVSVATPAAAMLLAMSAGFSALFVAAALAYAVALLATLGGKWNAQR